MSSFYNPLQRFYKFVLKRLLGQFLSSDLDLEQLDVALSSGDVALHRLSLNARQLNDWADGLPVSVQSARIASLHCKVPWRSLLSQHCTLRIRGLHVTLTPIATAEGARGGDGHSLGDSVYGAISDGLQRLSSRQLRQQVRLHRQLARDVHSQLDVEAAEEERRLAEEEAERDRDERARRRTRRRMRRLANRRAAQERVRTQEGGNVDPDTDTDADTNDERTDDDAEDNEWAQDGEQHRQQYNQRPSTHPRQASEVKEEEAEADEDIAAAGLRVVASFIERVVSMTEVSMDDITIALDCPLAAGDEQQRTPRTVRLELHIPSLEYCDMSRTPAAVSSSSTPSSTPSPAAASPSLPPLSAGPMFSYSKLIRLTHGFHLTLRTEDGEQLTIAHADVGQQCEVRVRLRMLDGGTVADTEIDVSSVRALLAPRQLSALQSLADVMGSSSCLAARNVSVKREAEMMRALQERSSAGGRQRANDGTTDSDWCGSGQRGAQQRNATGLYQQQSSSCSAQAPPPPVQPASSASPASLPSSAPSSQLWSIGVHLQHALIAVLEDDEAIRAEWWLEPVTLPHADPSPSLILAPLISGLSVDHLMLSLRHARIDASLSAQLLSSSLSVSELLVEEYLAQYRLLQSTVPSLSTDGCLVYERKQQRLGFSARRLMWFERRSGVHQQPLMQCSIQSAVNGALPRSEAEEARAEPQVRSRIAVHLLPVFVDIDLGLLSRLNTLCTTLSPPAVVEQPFPPALSFSMSSSLSTAPSDAALVMQRTLSDISSLSSPSSSIHLHARSAGGASATAAVSSPSLPSSISVEVSSVDVSVLFPADTASQAAVSTPLLRDGPTDCFDSRGLVRGERLALHFDRVTAACHSQPASASQQHVKDEDSVWTVTFEHAAVDLLFPKEEKQIVHSLSRPAALPRSGWCNPLHFHSKRILSTDYSAVLRPSATQLPCHTATLIRRAPLPPQSSHRASGGLSAQSADSPRQLEALFLTSLPTYRWFEPSEGQQRHNPPAAAGPFLPRAHQAGTAAAASFCSSLPPRTSAVPSAAASPDAELFEQVAAAHSSLVLDVSLASCSVHLSKVELDLLLLLYTIYDEISTPSPAQPAVQRLQPSPSQSQPQSQSWQHWQPFEATSDGRAVPVEPQAAPAAAAAAGGGAGVGDMRASFHSSSCSGSASESDSDGSDMEMFESVVGAESVFFHERSSGAADHRQPSESEEHVVALSDLDSSDLDGELADDEQLRAAALHNSQFGMHSVLMGRSQQLTHGQRRVTKAVHGSDAGTTVTTTATATNSLYTALLAAPAPALGSLGTVSDSLLFHSFVDQPASLSASTVLPAASSFVPVPEQPYKFVKPPPASAASSAFPSSASSKPDCAPSSRHRLSVRLSVREGGLCLQEEPVPLSLYSPPSAVPVSPSSLLAPQSFHLDVQHLHLFQCSKLDGKDVSYVSVRAADCTLREYLQPIAAADLLVVPSVPLLFKTLSDREPPNGSSAPLEPSSSHALWRDPVFVGQFIVALSPSLHLRETTAVLNLRALTLAYRPHSDWLGKLSDFFTLTAPPYVQTVGQPLQLNQHYTGFVQMDSKQDRKTLPAHQLAPPPMTQDLVRLAFHMYDACIDYNPPDIAARAVLLVDHCHLHTTVHPLSKQSSLAIELRDAAIFLMPASLKAREAAVASSVRVVAPPHLHRLPCDSIVTYLEELGCARVSVLDYLDARLVEQQDAQPLLRLELTNGELEVLTCADSFAALAEVASHIAKALVKQSEMREVQVTHFSHAQHTRASHAPDEHEHNGQVDQSAEQRAEREHKDDGEEDKDELRQSQLVRHQDQPSESDRQPEPYNRTDILLAVDPHLFGPDLGRAHREPASQPNIVDAYCDDMKRATSISLALQAAAEREIQKARRERQLNASIVAMQKHEEQRSRRKEAGGNADSGEHVNRSTAHCQSLDEDEVMGEQSGHWFSRSEMDEREVRDAMEQHSRTMPQPQPQLSSKHGDEKEDDAELRRRRECFDEEIEQQLETDRERRRRRQMDSGKQVSRKHQPMQPHIIEGHIAQPAEPPGIRQAAADSRAEGAAQAAIRRFRLGSATGGLLAGSELLLHNVSVRWKLFDGSDWVDRQPSVNERQQDGQERRQEAEDVGEIEYAGEQQSPEQQHQRGHSPAADLSAALNDSRQQLRVSLSPASAPRLNTFVHGAIAVLDDYVPSASTRRVNVRIPGATALTPATPTATALRSSSGGGALSVLPLVTPRIGRGVRHTDRMLEFSLRGIHLLHRSFSAAVISSSGPSSSSSLSLAVEHAEVIDGIASSPYRLLLSSNTASSAASAKANSSPAFCVDVLTVRANDRDKESREELRVETTLQPLRLSIDQDAVELLIAFFSRPLILHAASTQPNAESHVADLTFCQLFALTQPVQLVIDYQPRRVSYSALRHGDYAQLLHLFPLRKMAIALPAATLTGLSLSAVGSQMVTQWADDIARNQLHRYLSAIQPLRSIVNVGSGVVDCVLLPYSQYRKQGRLLRAVKRGVSGLAKHAAVEGLGLLLTVTQSANAVLREVDAIVAPAGASHALSPTVGGRGSGNGGLSLATRAPESLRAGLSVAYARLSGSMHDAAHSLVVVPRDEWTRGGGRLGVLSVVRNLPAAALQPMIGVTDALHATIMAAQNTVDSTLAHERNEMLKRPAE